MKFYRQTIEVETFRRAETPEVKPIWYRGWQVGHIRRFNDRLLLRLIAGLPLPPEKD